MTTMTNNVGKDTHSHCATFSPSERVTSSRANEDECDWKARAGQQMRLGSRGWTTKATTANTMITRTMATEATKPRITAAADEDDD